MTRHGRSLSGAHEENAWHDAGVQILCRVVYPGMGGPV